MLVAFAVGQLDQAQSVAAGQQAHRLGIDGDRNAGRKQLARGQVFFVEMDCHAVPLTSPVPMEVRP